MSQEIKSEKSPETPLNADQWLEENPRYINCSCCKKSGHDVVVSPLMDEYTIFVLTEAKKAMQHLKLNIPPDFQKTEELGDGYFAGVSDAIETISELITDLTGDARDESNAETTD